jgi:hypothetical protein
VHLCDGLFIPWCCFVFASAQWCSFHDLLICITFISFYYSILQFITLFYYTSKTYSHHALLLCIAMVLCKFFLVWFIAMSFCYAFLWWFHVHLPLMLLCFANALWFSPHDLLLCITFVFYSYLEFQHLNTIVFSPCKTSFHCVFLLFIFIMLFIVMILCSWFSCKVIVLFIHVQVIIFYNVEISVCMVEFVSEVGEYIYTTRTCNVQGTCKMLKMCIYYQLMLLILRLLNLQLYNFRLHCENHINIIHLFVGFSLLLRMDY